MKITRNQLCRIIKEEYENISEEEGREQSRPITRRGHESDVSEELIAKLEEEFKEIFADLQHAGVNVKESWADIKTRIMAAYKFASGQEE